jgi:hypothetical protein
MSQLPPLIRRPLFLSAWAQAGARSDEWDGELRVDECCVAAVTDTFYFPSGAEAPDEAEGLRWG